mmetsp:Transcript_3562/g.5157  ORF Transcript_3562/g.5157 Transcript_3562/m.5157 type:complete len:129 (+) Transcript_3562:933-1319(+)
MNIDIDEKMLDYLKSNYSSDVVREAVLEVQNEMSSKAGYQLLTKAAVIDCSSKKRGYSQGSESNVKDFPEASSSTKKMRNLGSSSLPASQGKNPKGDVKEALSGRGDKLTTSGANARDEKGWDSFGSF